MIVTTPAAIPPWAIERRLRSDEYAVIVVAPGVAFLERTDRVPLVQAITRYDYARLPDVKARTAFEPGVS